MPVVRLFLRGRGQSRAHRRARRHPCHPTKPNRFEPRDEASPCRLVYSSSPAASRVSPSRRGCEDAQTWLPLSLGEEGGVAASFASAHPDRRLVVMSRTGLQGHMRRCPPATNTGDLRDGAAIPPRGETGP